MSNPEYNPRGSTSGSNDENRPGLPGLLGLPSVHDFRELIEELRRLNDNLESLSEELVTQFERALEPLRDFNEVIGPLLGWKVTYRKGEPKPPTNED